MRRSFFITTGIMAALATLIPSAYAAERITLRNFKLDAINNFERAERFRQIVKLEDHATPPTVRRAVVHLCEPEKRSRQNNPPALSGKENRP